MEPIADVVVLARAGSRGVPKKCVRSIAGRPCIAWTIKHAQQSAIVRRVIVSTDDPLAAEVAESMGAIVRHRPHELATDTATVDGAVRDAIAWLDRAHGGCDAPVVMHYAAVPVRPNDLTDRAVGLLVSSGCDSVQSFAAVGKRHPTWTVRLENDGSLSPFAGDKLFGGVYRRQELTTAHLPDGGVTVVTRAALFDLVGAEAGPHAFLGCDRRGIETAEGDVVDIDAEIDVAVAEAVLRQLPEVVVPPAASTIGSAR